MSESYRENLPLLCDDYSDEDFHIRKSRPKLQRPFRYSASSGRARSQAIGAASIITRWPEHFSSLLTYWWIGLGMIAFMVFVMYTSIVAITMLPETHLKPVKYQDIEYSSENTSHEHSKTNVFMHIFVTNYEESNIKYYLPYIIKFSKKYSNLKHNLIVVLKDGLNDDLNNLSDELNIEMAWNSLWMENKKDEKIKLSENTNIQIISLTKYMDDSPLKKYWRQLPQQIIGFLTRCISIWDKGGIAFDPVILTPNSPNPGYTENLEHIINNLQSTNVIKSKKENILIHKKKNNNIRDIIDNIENQDQNVIQENLLEAETKKHIFRMKNSNINEIKRSTNEGSKKRYINKKHQNKTKSFEKAVYKNKINENSIVLSEERDVNDLSTKNKFKNENRLNDEVTTKHNLFPMFLKYLFHQPLNMTEHINEQSGAILNVTATTATSTLLNKKNRNSTLNNVVLESQQNNSKTNFFSKRKGLNVTYISPDGNFHKNENNISLSVDLKGILIATETPCHAFIGTIFSNVLHHSDNESISDFIITELSIFCKGVLSSCKGVDVILL